jgi:hypothetical protein
MSFLDNAVLSGLTWCFGSRKWKPWSMTVLTELGCSPMTVLGLWYRKFLSAFKDYREGAEKDQEGTED